MHVCFSLECFKHALADNAFISERFIDHEQKIAVEQKAKHAILGSLNQIIESFLIMAQKFLFKTLF